MFRAFLKDETGATAAEFGLMALLIAIGVIAGAATVGEALSAQQAAATP